MKRQEQVDSKDKKPKAVSQKDINELNEKELDMVSGGREESVANLGRDPWDDMHH